ncbi:MAG: alpha/beta fold hydrolase [Microvirga sp.]
MPGTARTDGNPRMAGGSLGCSYIAGSAERPVHVERIAASAEVPPRSPVVMVHGGCHTGDCYLSTPDGREGWAGLFARAGHEAYVVDWPGRGRSPRCEDLPRLSTREIADSLRVLVESIGPAILLVHSAGGPIGWWIAEAAPAAVAAVIGVAPGAPANILPVLPDDPAEIAKLRHDTSLGCPVLMPEDRPVCVDEEFIRTFWANAPRFPGDALASYCGSIVPESARVFNERFNIGGRGLKLGNPAALMSIPTLVVTGDHDPRHPRAVDEATARYVGAEFVWLPDRGITGNGHMPMIEDNSLEIAELLLAWLRDKGL